jgi:uncharacterized protein YjbI with pentapeptide repeats
MEITRFQLFDLLNRPGPLWLVGANLEDVDMQRANLRGANLNRTNLTGANLHQANLEGSDLRDAILVKVN